METIDKEIQDGIKTISERMKKSIEAADHPDKLGFDVPFTNMLVAKSNLILAKILREQAKQ